MAFSTTSSKSSWVYLLTVILYLPFVFCGYGVDNDTYEVLRVGRNYFDTGVYETSRNPGYLLYEFATYFLSSIGGSILCNLASLGMILVLLYSFRKIARFYQLRHINFFSILLVIHPLFIINGSSAMDYIWAIAMLMLGFSFLLTNSFYWAALVLALSIAVRLSSFIGVGVLFAFFLFTAIRNKNNQQVARILIAGVLCVVVAGSFYIPSYIKAGYSLHFLSAHVKKDYTWRFLLEAGKAVYKNILFLSVPGALIMGLLLIDYLRRAKSVIAGNSQLITIGLLVIAGYQLLFLRYPIEYEYLMPAYPFMLLLMAAATVKLRWLEWSFGICILLMNIIVFMPLKPDQEGDSKGAAFNPRIVPGILVENTKKKWKLKDCEDIVCWNEKMKDKPY